MKTRVLAILSVSALASTVASAQMPPTAATAQPEPEAQPQENSPAGNPDDPTSDAAADAMRMGDVPPADAASQPPAGDPDDPTSDAAAEAMRMGGDEPAAQDAAPATPVAIAGVAEAAAETPAPAIADPYLVTALPDWRREDLFLTEAGEYVRQAPNAVAVLTPGFGTGNRYIFRGLAGGGTYIDGIRLSERTANDIGLFDIDRVEVVRGPAPLLDALPSAAGSLQVALHRPGTEPYGEFEGYYGAFGLGAFRGSLDMVSANDVLGVNFSGYYQGTGGYVDNPVTGESLNQSDRWGGRLGLRLSPAADIDWFVSAAFMRAEGLNILNADCDDAGADCDDRVSLTGFSRDVDDLLTPIGGLPIAGDKGFFGLSNDTETALVTSDIEWRSNLGTVSLNAGFVRTSQEAGIDFADGSAVRAAGAPLPPATGYPLGGDLRLFDETRREFTFDGSIARRIGPANVKLGFSAHDRREEDDFAAVLTSGAAASPVSTLNADRLTVEDGNGYSVYGSADTRLGGLELALGGRFGEDTIDLRQTQRLTGSSGSSSTSYDYWGGYAQARYAPTDGTAIFARAVRGYELADYDPAALAGIGVGLGGPWNNWTYEGGLEGSLFGGRAQARLTGFYMTADDLPVPYAPGFTLLTAGQSGFENAGAELELALVPVDGLDISGAVGIQDARYDIGAGAATQQSTCLGQLAAGGAAPSCGLGIVTADGRIAEPVYAPDLTARGQISYDFYIPRAESYLTPMIGFDYRGDMETGSANLDLFDLGGTGSLSGQDFIGGSRADSRVTVNAGLTLRTDDDWWLVSLECDNCFDETYVDASDGFYSYLGTPMTWTIRARRKF